MIPRNYIVIAACPAPNVKEFGIIIEKWQQNPYNPIYAYVVLPLFLEPHRVNLPTYAHIGWRAEHELHGNWWLEHLPVKWTI